MKQKQKPVENPEQIEYRDAVKTLKVAELRIVLRSRGIDPYELSQKNIDDLRRLINKMQQVDAATKSKMKSTEQEGINEQAVISLDIEIIIARVFQEQNHMPPLPEMHPDTEQQEAEEGQQAQQEPTGHEEGSGKEPDIEQVDKDVQGISDDTGAGEVGIDRSDSEPKKPE
ncbi:MAG: hypothetical protein Q8S44_02885 [Flavobacteriaceae bacterium]|nr:hypothetical protein [Flavobacteriaceae bacterium]